MTIEFPRELVHEFLDYLAKDFRTLKSCSLVCREWVFPSRSHLFERCGLWPSKILRFCDLLRSPACTILPHVRSIHGLKHRGPEDYDSFHKIAVDLGRLTNVRELEMLLNVYHPADMDPFLLTAVGPNLTRLALTFESREPPQPVVNIICLFPALQELVIRTSCVFEDIPADTAPPPHLRSLVLDEIALGPTLAWLDAAGQLPNIRSLRLPCVNGPDVGRAVTAALRRLGELGALHHLDITLHEGGFDEAVDVSAVFDLSLHPNLRTLDIRDEVHFGKDHQALQMIALITKLAAPALEHLSLDLNLNRSMYQRLDWAPLDAFLTAATRFPRLRDVMFRCIAHVRHWSDDCYERYGDEEHEFLRRALPLLEASGLLQTEW